MRSENLKKFEAFVSDYAREPVPHHKSTNWLHIGLVIIGVAIAVPAFLLGSVLGNSLGIVNSFLAISLGAAILTVISIFTAIVGTKTRLSTYMISKFTFGRSGAKIVTLIMAITLFGWFGINTEIFGVAAQQLLNLGLSTWIIIGGLLMISTALIGFRGLDKLSLLTVPLLLVLLAVFLIKMLQQKSFSELAVISGSGMPLGVAISIVVGAFMVGAVITPDLTRYAKNVKNSVGAVILGFLIGFPIVLFLTSILSVGTGQGEFIAIMASLGWIVPAVIILIFASWTTNDNNLYSAALGLSAIFQKGKKWQFTLGAGILGIILALAGILDQFISWLILLSITIPPIAGLYIGDFFVLKRSYNLKDLDTLPAFRILPFICWIAAIAFAYATTPDASGGLGLFSFTRVPALDSIIVAFVLYTLLSQFKR